MSYTLSQPLGNNIFSYDLRKQLGSDTTLVIPDLRQINSPGEIMLGDFIVFEEIDNAVLHSCTGLAHTYLLQTNGPTIIITDNHNHVLPHRLQHISQSPSPSPRLIHIDQHSDLGPNHNQLDLSMVHDTQYQRDFAHLSCNIGNFITPCIDSGVISHMTQVRTEYKLHEVSVPSSSTFNISPLIVDIDIDFRAPEMGISFDKTKHIAQGLMSQASLITIASSPYFIDQQLALRHIQELLTPFVAK